MNIQEKYSIKDFSPNVRGDNDTYKWYDGQLFAHQFPDATAEYKFINRNHSLSFPPHFGERLEELVGQMARYRLDEEQKEYMLEKAPYLKRAYMDEYQEARFKPEQVAIDQYGDELDITISGLAKETTYWEIPLMYTIVGLNNKLNGRTPLPGWETNLRTTIQRMREEGVRLALFGSRRRHSPEAEEAGVIIGCEIYGDDLIVSNPYWAWRHNANFGGSTPHELYQAMAAVYGYKNANYQTLLHLHQEFGSNLRTALTDTFTTEVFLENYLRLLKDRPDIAKIFTRFREDSMGPFEYVKRIKQFCAENNLPMDERSFLFSNSLDLDETLTVLRFCEQEGITDGYGIGTFLSHTLTGHKGANVVIKLTKFNGVEVCKLSDKVTKHSGSDSAIRAAYTELGLPMEQLEEFLQVRNKA